MITITEKATQEITKSLNEIGNGLLLRIKVTPGGCAGFKYQMTADALDGVESTDTVVNDLVVVDDKSLTMLDGSTVDFVEDLQGGGIVINNPNAKGGCGCGKSFC